MPDVSATFDRSGQAGSPPYLGLHGCGLEVAAAARVAGWAVEILFGGADVVRPGGGGGRAFHPDEEDADVAGGDAGDAVGLADGDGADLAELLAALIA